MGKRRKMDMAALVAVLASTLVAASGCATTFSPGTIREEIVRQQGRDPLSAFELQLGRFTTRLLKEALVGTDGELPFAGLASLELAVFEAPADAGPAIDVTAIPVRGWDPVMRAHDPTRSGMVLIRGSRSRGEAAATIADLVVVGSGERQVVYARLKGRLDPTLPAALGDVLREAGPARLREILTGLAGEG